MKAAICLEHRFFEYNNRIYDNTVYHRSFWKPYVDVFDNISIIARVKELDSIDETYKEVDIDGVSFLKLNEYSSSLISITSILQNIFLLQSYSRQIDGAIIRTPCFMGYFLWLLLLLKKKPYAIELVGDIRDISGTLSAKYQRLIRRYFYYYIVKLQCKHAFITSYVTNKYLQKRYPNSDKTKMFGWSTIQLEKDTIRKEPKEFPEDRTWVFIYTANFALYKGHEYLLNLLNNLNSTFTNWKMILIGDGNHKEKIQQLTKNLELDGKVHFYGFLPNFEVNKKLELSDVYITTSLTEGLPRAIVEAISKGLPVVGYNVGGIAEVVEEQHLVRPKDNDDLLEKLKSLLVDKQKFKETSERNIEHSYNFTTDTTRPIRLKSYKEFKICLKNKK